jgi:hypothetical protein
MAPHGEQSQVGADLVAPTMGKPEVAEPAAPAVEEPPATGLTLPGGGAHDEGDPGDDEVLGATTTSADPTGAGVGVAGGALSSAA